MTSLSTLIALSKIVANLSQDGLKELMDFEFAHNGGAEMKFGFIQAIFKLCDRYSKNHLNDLLTKAEEIEQNEAIRQHNQSILSKTTLAVKCKIASFLSMRDITIDLANVSSEWLTVARHTPKKWDSEAYHQI